jgi:hypothetical protein
MKTQKQTLFSSFGSPSRIVLEIEGFAPVDLSPRQHVVVATARWRSSSRRLGLSFTFGEVKDLCAAMIGTRGFAIDDDVLQHLFTLTNGHPGFTHSILADLFKIPVSGDPKRL